MANERVEDNMNAVINSKRLAELVSEIVAMQIKPDEKSSGSGSINVQNLISLIEILNYKVQT